jgi:hypothetical protein
MNFQNVWLKYGVISGLALIASSIITFYLIDFGIFTNALLVFGIMVVFMVIGGLEFRKENQNVMLYGEAFKVTFLTGIISLLISTTFTYVLVSFIDEGLLDIVIEKTIESTQNLLTTLNAPEAEIDEAIEGIEDAMVKQFSLGGILQGLFSNAVICAILAAIVSIFLRKDEKPV